MNMVLMKPGYDGRPSTIEPIRDDAEAKGKRELFREVRYDSIGRLFQQKIIEKHHWEAACCLQLQAEAAELRSRSSTTGIHAVSGVYALSDGQIERMSRHADARQSVTIAMGRAGSLGETLLRLVVLENHSLHAAAKIMAIQERAISVGLRFALDVLARHYKLS